MLFRSRIDVTSRIVRLLDMHPGDVIDICRDGPEYYLYIRHRAADIVGRHRGQAYPTTRGGHGSYRAWSVSLARAIRQAAGRSGDTLRLLCGRPETIAGRTYIPIIIRHAI